MRRSGSEFWFGVPPSGGPVRRPAFRRDWLCKRRPPEGGTPNRRRPHSVDFQIVDVKGHMHAQGEANDMKLSYREVLELGLH